MIGVTMIAKKKPNADFVIRLDAKGIKPWAVPFRNLAGMMEAVQRLFQGASAEEPGEYEGSEGFAPLDGDAEKVLLQLLDVKSTSAAYRVATTDGAASVARLESLRKGLDNPQSTVWLGADLSSIEELSALARRFECVIEFRLPGKGRAYGDVIAEIGPGSFGDIACAAFVHGHTSVYAKIERVGGATERNCGIRLLSQPRKMVVCGVPSEELVRELGQYIYQDVVVSGRATWLKANNRLRRMEISSFEPPKKRSILEALDRIYAAGGDAWDSIEDPDAVLAEMRGR